MNHHVCVDKKAGAVQSQSHNIRKKLWATKQQQQQQTLFYGYYTGQAALAGTPVKNWRILLVQFYCPHALADGNQRIRIRKKMLKFTSTVLSTLLPYLIVSIPYLCTL